MEDSDVQKTNIILIQAPFRKAMPLFDNLIARCVSSVGGQHGQGFESTTLVHKIDDYYMHQLVCKLNG